MTDYEPHILSILMAHVGKILVALVVPYDLMIGHEDEIAGMNPFQRLND